MPLPARLFLDRPDRIPLDRAGTLRDSDRTPIDVTVENISSSGCLVTTSAELPEDALVTIGIAGIGRRTARIVRKDAARHGLAFLEPPSEIEVLAARTAETLVDGGFPVLPETDEAPDAETSAPRLHPRTRMIAILGASLLLWAVIGVVGAIVFLD